jgi:hypothetical protein
MVSRDRDPFLFRSRFVGVLMMCSKRVAWLLLGWMSLSLLGGGANAEPPRRKGGDVNGAIWQFSATNGPSVRGTSEKPRTIEFRYRAEDLVLHDMVRNEVIGKSEPKGPDKSRVTFNEEFRFPCTFDIEKISKDPPVWKGKAEFKGQTWYVTMRMIRN